MNATDPPSDFTLVVDPGHAPPALWRGVYAIGNFDGVHRGHRAIIERTKALARERGAPSAVLTFEPHPADYFAGRPVVFRLTPFAAKARALQNLGLDGVVVLSFDAALANLSAEAFIDEILVRTLQVGAAVVGADFHFGKGRAGTPAFLVSAGLRHGFAVEALDKIELIYMPEAEPISSTAIRRALERGDVEGAALRLGRPYEAAGVVVAGQKLGRTLGFPTANLQLEPTNRLAHGIYAVRTILEGKVNDGVASFGVRPTVAGVEPLLEVYIFDFAGEIYGRELTVQFVARIRDELKFDSLAALTAQMERDAEGARALLAVRPFGVSAHIL